MKKIIYITCCFVFAGVCSSSECTLSDNYDHPRAFSSSDSSISDDSQASLLKHADRKNSKGKYKGKRQKKAFNSMEHVIDIENCKNEMKKAAALDDLLDKYRCNPCTFLSDLNMYLSGQESEDVDADVRLKNLIYTLYWSNFFYESWHMKYIKQVENNKYIKKIGLRLDESMIISL